MGGAPASAQICCRRASTSSALQSMGPTGFSGEGWARCCPLGVCPYIIPPPLSAIPLGVSGVVILFFHRGQLWVGWLARTGPSEAKSGQWLGGVKRVCRMNGDRNPRAAVPRGPRVSGSGGRVG